MAKKPETKVLERALARIEKGWTQGATARDKDGDVISVYSTNAIAWCAFGAISAATRSFDLADNAAALLDRTCKHGDIVAWNDEKRRTKRQVVAKFKKAIKLSEASDG